MVIHLKNTFFSVYESLLLLAKTPRLHRLR